MMPLVGREDELAALDELAAAALAGAGAPTIIEGPAGIGKSALLAEATQRAREAGLRALTARGGEWEQSFAFSVAHQMFEPVLAGSASERHLDGAAAGARRVLGAPSDAPPTPSREDATFGALHGLYWLVANLAAERPLLLTVDDVQWCDEPSLRFLNYLSRRIEDLPVALVLTLRSGDAPAAAAVLSDLCQQDGARTLRLLPLGKEAVQDAILAEYPDADESFCAACERASAGNPFLLGELLAAVAAEGIEPSDASTAKVELLSSQPVAQRVLGRIERLGPDGLALTQAMAVLGDETELRLAAALAQQEEVCAIDHAATLVRVDVLAWLDPFTFAHPLVRRSVYDHIAPARRSAQHAAAAALLEAADQPLDAVASHLLQTRPGGSPPTVRTLRRAAARAMGRAAPEVAVTYLRRALREPPDRSEKPDVLSELTLAEQHIGDRRALEHGAQARELARDLRERAQRRYELGLAHMSFMNVQQAATEFRKGYDELDGHDGELRAALQGELLVIASYSLDDLHELVAQLVPLSDERPPGPEGATLQAVKALCAWHTGEPRERVIGLCTNALADVEHDAANGIEIALQLLNFMDVPQLVDPVLQRFTARARASGSARRLSYCHWNSAYLALSVGDLAAAELHAEREWALLQGTDYPADGLLVWPSAIRAIVFLEQGRLGDAELAVSAIGDLAHLDAEHWPLVIGFLPLLYARGRIRVARGDHAAGLEDLLWILDARRRVGWTGDQMPPVDADAALALLGAGERLRAQELIDASLAAARAFGMPRSEGLRLRVAGLISGGEPGIELLHESVAVLDRSHDRLERTKSLIALGEALRRANRRSEGREHLASGMELAHECGAAALVARARDELRAAGARPRRIVRSGVDSLTASELRIVRMAAEGASNREIAQDLYLSVKTVEMHLTRAYSKLNLSGHGARRRLAGGLASVQAGGQINTGLLPVAKSSTHHA